MGFLKCKLCGGYYELKYGESLDDFGTCRCGGSLKYVRNLKAARIDELGPFSKAKNCPKCRKENVKTSKICVFCGQKLNKDRLTLLSELLRLASIFIGIMVVLIPLVLFPIDIDLIIIGGFVSSVLASRNEREGILDGIILGLVSGLIFSVYKGILGVNPVFYNLNLVCVILIGSVIMGLLGGLSGAIVRSTVTNKNLLYSVNFKAIIVGFIVCAIPFLFFQSVISLIMAILGGSVAAYLVGETDTNGIRNGFIVGSLSAIMLVVLFVFIHINDPAMIIGKIFHMGVVLIIGGLLGSVGGLIGINIKNAY